MSVGLAVAVAVLAVLTGSAAWVMHRSGAALSTVLATAATAALVLTGLAVGGDVTAFAVAGFVAAPLALVTFPSGIRDRLTAVVSLVAVVAGGLAVAVPAATDLGSMVLALVVTGRVWWEIERGDAQDRAALLWVVAVTGAAGLVAVLVLFTGEALDTGGDSSVVDVVTVLLACAVPASMAIGVVNPEVVDVKWLATTLAVTLTVLVCFLAAASVLVFGFEALAARPLPTPAAIALCAVLALAVAPTRAWLYDTVDQMLFGGRPDPVEALASVAAAVGDDLVGSLEAVRVALVLPYARLEVEGRAPVIAGVATPHVSTLPLDLGDGGRGSLVVGHRPGERRWSREDLGVLALVAPLLARTVRAQRLAEEVAASRSEAVAAIEDERRRLRRDLHDGLGPTLSGVAFSADAARNLVRRDPAGAEELLTRLRSDTADAIAEVRRLVEGLRPPALDQLGLVGALRTWVEGLHGAGGARLEVDFAGTDDVGALSAAGEVAAYRIAVEALTNVARHSGSPTATVRFSRGPDCLVLEVADRGVGGPWRPGVGLSAMRERAELVGGRVEAGGGRVRAELPVEPVR